jgi:hypothetical protein
MKKIEIVLVSLALLCTLPFLVIMPALLLLWLLYHLFPSPRWFWLEIPVFFSARLLSDPARYVAFSLLALGLSAGALLWLITRERGRFWRRRRFYLLALLIVAVLAFPLFARYRPAVEAPPGAELRVVERPGWVAGAVRWCQAAAEISACQYEPLGWADAQTLVYRKWCGGHYTPAGWQPGEPQPPRAYDVKTGAITPFEGSIEHLLGERGPRAIATLDYFPGKYAGTSISPDGRWIAFTARHVYGPEDLLVMLQE